MNPEEYEIGMYLIRISREALHSRPVFKMELFQVLHDGETRHLEECICGTRHKALKKGLERLPYYGKKWGWG